MKRFRIQVYDRDMVNLIREIIEDYDDVADALSAAFACSSPVTVVALMVNSDCDSRFWKLIAKFY